MNNIIARVVLENDGFIHIAFNNGEMVYASLKGLLELFCDPYEFINNLYKQYQITTKKFINAKTKLSDVPGLTLARVYEDLTVDVIHPIIFIILQKEITFLPKYPISLSNLTQQKYFSSSKDWHLKKYLEFSRPDFADHKIMRNISLSNDYKELFLTEMMNTTNFIEPLTNCSQEIISTPDVSSSTVYEISKIPQYVSVEKYADNYSLTTSNVYKLLKNNALKTAHKNKGSRWLIDIDEPPPIEPLEKSCPETELSSNEKTITTIIPQKVSIKEYCNKYSIKTVTAYYWAQNGVLKSAAKDKNGKWLVDIMEEPPKHLNRTHKKKSNGQYVVRKDHFPDSYEGTQEYIKERKLFTSAIRPYIRTKDEANYYFNNNYHEVVINGKAALIIDINPYFYCSFIGKTNIELINDGKAPVVPKEYPNAESVERFHIHHIGQNIDSPFAIIPEKDHSNLFSIFHQGAWGIDLHTKEFEAEKRVFWRKYIELYENCGSYRDIPFNNSKHKRDMRD